MIGFPFDSHVTYDDNGTPQYDRAISSLPYRSLLKKLFTTGIMPNPSTNLQVIAGDGMSVVVQAGFAMVEGCMKLEESNVILELEPSHDTYNRIDTVVMRLNSNDSVRSCELFVIQGAPSSNPVRPELTRTSSIYEIGLADILIKSNSVKVNDINISDTRYETERCGIVSSISEFDTTTLYYNYEVAIKEWFDNIRGILDEDAAVHLQNEIDKITSEISNIKGTELINTLTSGTTSLTFTDNSITENSSFDFYTDDYKVTAKSVLQSGNSLTMTFKAQSKDVKVKVVIKNAVL